MVASILRLRLASLGSTLRRPRGASGRGSMVLAIGILVVVVVALVAMASVVSQLVPDLHRAALTCIGSIVVLSYSLLPLIFGADDGLNPRAFTWFGIRPAKLAGALALAGLFTPPALLLIIFVVVQASTWKVAGAGVVAVSVVGGVLAIVMAVLGARIAATIAGEIGDGPSARGIAGLIGIAVLALAAPAFAVFATLDWSAVGATELRRWAAVLSWTPIGAPFAAAGDVALGHSGLAVARIGIAFAAVAVLALVWVLIARRATSSSQTVREARRTDGIGLFGAFPATQVGAVAARSAIYWIRDPRYSVPPLLLPIIPLVLVGAFALAGVPGEITIWLPIPLVCLVIGWLVHNDVSTDGTAFWLHVVSGIGGRADRWGRTIVPLILGIPVAIGGSIATAAIWGDPSIIPPLMSLSICALLSGLGVASAVSARSPYPSVAPGDKAFALPQQSGDGHAAYQGSTLLLAALACVPTGVLIGFGMLRTPDWMLWATISGLVMGLAVLFIGIESGARVVSRAGPELLAFARSN